MLKSYTILDHTADIGLLCKGETIEAVFEAGAEGMFSILIDSDTVSVKERHYIKVKASTYDDLFVQWLQELIYRFSTKYYFYSEFSVKISNDDSHSIEAAGVCGGERIDPDVHSIFTEIKTATYHQLMVKKTKTGWEGKVIFDL